MPDVTVGVREEDDGTFAGYCSGPGCAPFTTRGWPNRDSAAARIRQHKAEHESGEAMQPLSEFRADHGLTVNGAGLVVPDDEKVE